MDDLNIDLRQIVARTGIPFEYLIYDAQHGKIPARIVGKSWRVPLRVAQAIIADPERYRAWRQQAGHRLRRVVVYNNERFESITALARAIKKSRETIHKMIKRGEVTVIDVDRQFQP